MGKMFSLKKRPPNPTVPETCLFLKNYLNVSYFMCLSPYYYKFENGHFTYSSCKPYKFYCAISCILSFLFVFGELRMTIFDERTQKNPVYYLQVMRFSEYTFQKCVILIKFWTCKDTFVKTLNFLEYMKQNKILSSAKSKLVIKVLAHFIIGLYVILGVMYLCDGIVLLAKPKTNKFVVHSIWKELIILGKYNYFIDNIFLNSTTNLLDTIVGVFSAIGYVPR